MCVTYKSYNFNVIFDVKSQDVCGVIRCLLIVSRTTALMLMMLLMCIVVLQDEIQSQHIFVLYRSLTDYDMTMNT